MHNLLVQTLQWLVNAVITFLSDSEGKQISFDMPSYGIVFLYTHACICIYSERYRDLIEAADTISAMKSSAENVRERESVCVFVHMHAYLCLYISVCVCVCVCVCVVCVCVCVCE